MSPSTGRRDLCYLQMSFYGPAELADGIEEGCAEIQVAERAAHVPHVDLAGGRVLPYQVGMPVAVEIGHPDGGPAGHSRGGQESRTEEGVTNRAAHVPHIDLPGGSILPHQVWVAVIVEVGDRDDGPAGHPINGEVCCA